METITAENLNKQDLKPFSYVNGKINVIEFLEATSSLIKVIERLGKAFAPVKYDMEGNVEKIKKYYKYDNNSCLLELMAEEHSKGKSEAAEGILWLNRALLFFELIFQQIIVSLQTNNNEVDMNKIYNMAYEGSVKKYHNWITQQLFALICKVAPNFTQILKSFEVENNLNQFEEKLTNFNSTLHSVRTKIDDFFKERNLFSDS
ncbi:LOW QUALITY PROTEIN: glycolipid transfer protein [Melitaea cinxia]|uniref:LOW QUALITY PROTEIN: glycolipid transfer protein n=1 Tax=Melitaea cinxia TaxID=113334 RepID=UPI001E271359|nr:LOW QUALITY PROTEIN: glycolipid transfer protein [Melitaea cinxia]